MKKLEIIENLTEVKAEIETNLLYETKFKNKNLENLFLKDQKEKSLMQNILGDGMVICGYIANLLYIFTAYYKKLILVYCLTLMFISLGLAIISYKINNISIKNFISHIQVFLISFFFNSKIFIINFYYNTMDNDNSEELLRIIIYDYICTNLFVLVKLECNLGINFFYFFMNLISIIISECKSNKPHFYYLDSFTSLCVSVIFYIFSKAWAIKIRDIFSEKYKFENLYCYTYDFLNGINGYQINFRNKKYIDCNPKFSNFMNKFLQINKNPLSVDYSINTSSKTKTGVTRLTQAPSYLSQINNTKDRDKENDKDNAEKKNDEFENSSKKEQKNSKRKKSFSSVSSYANSSNKIYATEKNDKAKAGMLKEQQQIKEEEETQKASETFLDSLIEIEHSHKIFYFNETNRKQNINSNNNINNNSNYNDVSVNINQPYIINNNNNNLGISNIEEIKKEYSLNALLKKLFDDDRNYEINFYLGIYELIDFEEIMNSNSYNYNFYYNNTNTNTYTKIATENNEKFDKELNTNNPSNSNINSKNNSNNVQENVENNGSSGSNSNLIINNNNYNNNSNGCLQVQNEQNNELNGLNGMSSNNSTHNQKDASRINNTNRDTNNLNKNLSKKKKKFFDVFFRKIKFFDNQIIYNVILYDVTELMLTKRFVWDENKIKEKIFEKIAHESKVPLTYMINMLAKNKNSIINLIDFMKNSYCNNCASRVGPDTNLCNGPDMSGITVNGSNNSRSVNNNNLNCFSNDRNASSLVSSTGQNQINSNEANRLSMTNTLCYPNNSKSNNNYYYRINNSNLRTRSNETSSSPASYFDKSKVQKFLDERNFLIVKDLELVQSLSQYLYYLMSDISHYLSFQDLSSIRLEKEKIKVNDIIEFVFNILNSLLCFNKSKRDKIKTDVIYTKDNFYDIKNISVTVDAFKIKQILLNFISNSVKFTYSGKIFIECSLKHSLNDARNIFIISIIDTGLGIKGDEKAQLRTKFIKIEDEIYKENQYGMPQENCKNSNKNNINHYNYYENDFNKFNNFNFNSDANFYYGNNIDSTFPVSNKYGSGIKKSLLCGIEFSKNQDNPNNGYGLLISKFLAEVMGLKIEFDSEYGKGSKFSLEIPLGNALIPTYNLFLEENNEAVLNKKSYSLRNKQTYEEKSNEDEVRASSEMVKKYSFLFVLNFSL